ncbi:MAG: DUF3486 family protein [Pseudomonadota bacterium]
MVSGAAKGRGRLSSIDMLPEEADEDIVWALDQLRENKLPQTTILMEFNERLADKQIEPISKSAWNRYSVRKAKQFRRLDEAQRMGSELVQSMGAEQPDEVTIAVAEMLKVAAFEVLEENQLSPKGIMELSRALQSAVGAQKASAEYRERLERQLSKTADKVETMAAEAGLSAERIAQLRRDFLGIREGKAP